MILLLNITMFGNNCYVTGIQGNLRFETYLQIHPKWKQKRNLPLN